MSNIFRLMTKNGSNVTNLCKNKSQRITLGLNSPQPILVTLQSFYGLLEAARVRRTLLKLDHCHSLNNLNFVYKI